MLQQYGVVMAAIVVLSLAAWLLIGWKWLELREQRRHGIAWADQVIDHVRKGLNEQARSLCKKYDTLYLGRLLGQAVTANEPQREFFEKRLRPMLESEADMLRRRLALIATLGTLAPLLGLLGTVLGMLRTFDALRETGVVTSSSFSGGISQVLLTTQAGLVTALPIVLAYWVLNTQAQQCIDTAKLYTKKIETVLCHD
ncbi:MAG: MotA/TolQ/ExbB proton channel family protein [Candidatus Loosdrechtia sp.]|uniref:MotA/TolQ/ExbB proton channel family protein n=1 Tax=Candidatus Loosdrechtia sp. TaxID=3101272 RepID=UPI003A6F9E12|nr:MAG: MotA/TolQ/ExbB proton channel family protein [Candidatus Jettenia sp. AMX2]